jgi:hypothetical protein
MMTTAASEVGFVPQRGFVSALRIGPSRTFPAMMLRALVQQAQ